MPANEDFFGPQEEAPPSAPDILPDCVKLGRTLVDMEEDEQEYDPGSVDALDGSDSEGLADDTVEPGLQETIISKAREKFLRMLQRRYTEVRKAAEQHPNRKIDPKFLSDLEKCEAPKPITEGEPVQTIAVNGVKYVTRTIGENMECPICSKHMKRSRLSVHIDAMHFKYHRYGCERCKRRYSTKRNLQAHVQKCSEVRKRKAASAGLEDPGVVKRTQNMPLQYQCTKCLFTTKIFSDAAYHHGKNEHNMIIVQDGPSIKFHTDPNRKWETYVPPDKACTRAVQPNATNGAIKTSIV